MQPESTKPSNHLYGSLKQDDDCYLKFSSNFQTKVIIHSLSLLYFVTKQTWIIFHFQTNSERLPPPRNRLDDDLAKIHAEKYKTETTWYQQHRPIDATSDTESITTVEEPIRDNEFDFEDCRNEDGVLFIDVQGAG